MDNMIARVPEGINDARGCMIGTQIILLSLGTLYVEEITIHSLFESEHIYVSYDPKYMYL